MYISIPKERTGVDRRVAVTPRGAATLVAAGHRVLVESGAGAGAGHEDDDYVRARAEIVWSREEAFARGDLVIKVVRPEPDEIALLPVGGAIATFLHLAVAPRAIVDALAERRVTAVALERIEVGGERPVLDAMSEIAGRLCPQIAGHLLETTFGRGVLLSGVPGVAAAEVVVLGAGTVGRSAARAFAALGTQVTVLDRDVRKLRALEPALALAGGRAALLFADEAAIARSVAYADVVVGAVHVPGERAPVLIRASLVERMRRDAVIIDLSIDQGGCCETSRPTTLLDPIYRERGVIHYCVPDTPALVARTASHALSQAIAPLLAGVPRSLSFGEGLDHDHPLHDAAVRLHQ